MEPQTKKELLLTYNKHLNQHGLLMKTLEAESPLLSEDEYHLSYFVVALCEQGTASFNYDFSPVEIRPCDIFFGLPGHIVTWWNASKDFRIRTIGISDELYNKIKNQHLSHNIDLQEYNNDNIVSHLGEEQYAMMCNAFDMLQMVSKAGKTWREDMILNVFQAIIMLRYEFCPVKKKKEKKPASSLSMRFQEAVVKHYRETRDVDFYARMFGLTPKYFSYLIKSEIGIAPKRWINNFIAMQAKTMLIKRSDLNIQQVAYLLGFDEQTSFTRFFKIYVGMSPKEYRDNPGAIK